MEIVKKVWATVKNQPSLVILLGLGIAAFGFFQMKSSTKKEVKDEAKI